MLFAVAVAQEFFTKNELAIFLFPILYGFVARFLLTRDKLWPLKHIQEYAALFQCGTDRHEVLLDLGYEADDARILRERGIT